MVCHIQIGLKQFITAKLKTNNKSFMDRIANFAYCYSAGLSNLLKICVVSVKSLSMNENNAIILSLYNIFEGPLVHLVIHSVFISNITI